MTPTRESMLLPLVQAHFRRQYSISETEVPFFDHRIDLYGYSRRTMKAVAVELKLRDWRKAFRQALVYQLCSDYAFIAVPRVTARRVDVDALEAHGVGLLAVTDKRCYETLPARLSTVLNPAYKARHAALVAEGRHASR